MREVLDHGYVKKIETWGSDEQIIEAARMSTNKGFLGWGGWRCANDACSLQRFATGEEVPDDHGLCPKCGADDLVGQKAGDERLLRYLYENKHMTPFEMGGLTIEVQAPIFVFREWHRHRTQSYNEMSARYTPLPDLNYIPTVERLMINAGTTNKQAGTISGSDVLTEQLAREFQFQLEIRYRQDEEFYQASLKAGIPKELARLVLPVGRYSRMRASANLRNWLGFLTLRSAPGAQWEIRQFAEAVSIEVAKAFPRTYLLFAEGSA